MPVAGAPHVFIWLIAAQEVELDRSLFNRRFDRFGGQYGPEAITRQFWREPAQVVVSPVAVAETVECCLLAAVDAQQVQAEPAPLLERRGCLRVKGARSAAATC